MITAGKSQEGTLGMMRGIKASKHAIWAAILVGLSLVFAPQTAHADDTQYISERYGIPLHQNHLVWPDQNIPGSSTIPGGVAPADLHNRWRLFWNEQNYLRSNRDFDTTVALLVSTLTDLEKQTILANIGVNDETIQRYDSNFEFILRNEIDEFTQQDLTAAMRRSADQGKAGKLVGEPIRIVNIADSRLGRFDFDKYVLPFSRPPVLKLNGVEVPYSDRSSWGIIVEETSQQWREAIALPRDLARSIVQAFPSNDQVLGQVRRAAFGIYGTLTFGERAAAYTITDVDFAYDRALKSLALPVALSDVIIDRDAEQRKRRQEQEAVAKRRQDASRQAQMVSFPDRTFEVLGIELGMSSATAQAALAVAYPEATITLPQVDDAGSQALGRYELPRDASGGMEAAICNRDADGIQRTIESEMKRALSIADQERAYARLRGEIVPEGDLTLSDEQLAEMDARFKELIVNAQPACVAHWENAGKAPGEPEGIKLFFSARADLGGGIADHISVFGFNDEVSLVLRELDGAPRNVIESFQKGLLERFGRETHSVVDGDYFWLSTEAIHNELTFDRDKKDDCLVRVFRVSQTFINVRKPNLGRFRVKCGAFATIQTNKMMLADSDRLLTGVAAAEATAAEGENENEPTIRF
ncbi:MAG: hypothetical protein JJ926_07950 [Roseitalea sp.]|nr:hypothetical protein [Roseitalea sp.]MBO6951799.1 hypothetical protein [Rhizobiaceae bacterium]MBO6592355.1 hypothetical protein [Roseitalea sp.]MBO6598610.1 hypothetical protein [Roseitalea sp.]MBO6611056.1 hypothetical protein [Roseitalea sp.]